MFPLLALGAVFAGTFIAEAATASSKSDSKAPRTSAQTQAAVSPQSYLVTPVQGSSAKGAEPVSIVDAIGKFIV